MTRWLLVFSFLFTLSNSNLGQDESYTLTLSEESVAVGEIAMVQVRLTNTGDALDGYQFGVCHDDGDVTISADDIANGGFVEDHVFLTHDLVVFDEGWTVVALADLDEGTLAIGDDLDLYEASYSVLDSGVLELEFCETLGDPAVTVRVIVEDEEVEPVVVDGSIEGLPLILGGDGNADGARESMLGS